MTQPLDPILLGLAAIHVATIGASDAYIHGDVDAALAELDTVAEAAIAIATVLPKHTEPRL